MSFAAYYSQNSFCFKLIANFSFTKRTRAFSGEIIDIVVKFLLGWRNILDLVAFIDLRKWPGRETSDQSQG